MGCPVLTWRMELSGQGTVNEVSFEGAPSIRYCPTHTSTGTAISGTDPGCAATRIALKVVYQRGSSFKSGTNAAVPAYVFAPGTDVRM
eukprot:1444878-Rhodomonas_salina.4